MEPTQLLCVAFGVVVGFSLGLTGGGGAIFAVPLLVYGLAMAPHQAVVISLAAVGTTALVGLLARLYTHQLDLRTGLVFALAGMAGAPVGAYLATLMPESVLLILFSLLMLVIAANMWIKGSHHANEHKATTCPIETNDAREDSTCNRDMQGNLILTSRCAILLLLLGVVTGVLSGMFGIGGGFVIVPALTFFSTMSMPRAIGTSLLVIAMVSISGVISQLSLGYSVDMSVFLTFLVGCLVGLGLGTLISSSLSEKLLQKIFAIAIILVSLFILSKSFL